MAGLVYDAWSAVPAFVVSAAALPVLAALFIRHLTRIHTA